MTRRTRPLGVVSIEEPQVNLTPLIDVVFVILITFIVMAPLLELERVELAEAGDHEASETVSVQSTSPITIHVHRDNSITLNKQAVTLEQLATFLIQLKQQYPNVHPQLLHDKRGHFGTYQAVKNAAESAGFTQMDIILKP